MEMGDCNATKASKVGTGHKKREIKPENTVGGTE